MALTRTWVLRPPPAPPSSCRLPWMLHGRACSLLPAVALCMASQKRASRSPPPRLSCCASVMAAPGGGWYAGSGGGEA